ncbi:uncharacterized protein BO97DRAFT_415994 [Aspergillus homomorphus CBS 101889]|uniref:Uncharacterized protein n=1 Tax=Aspergillus homomorphus (strain CBS 101889) TaxID=1450537 RepID=A0A395HSR8_ASPHC|nr:hypothetical protein BO97DRAFT_415994 [Aspergillus homomorphus CBS 101889]RAL10463.1 hypothetical protein BO97DRAFT_415994 [Aspergillus homomorphus CBS 101889]
MPVEKGEWWTSREEARDVLIEQLRDHLSAAGHRGLVGVHWDMTIICISCIGASEPRTALDLLDQLPLEPGDAHICTSRMSRQERIHILENHGSLFLNCLARPSLLRGVGYFAIDGYPIQVHVLEAVIMPFERGSRFTGRFDDIVNSTLELAGVESASKS